MTPGSACQVHAALFFERHDDGDSIYLCALCKTAVVL